MTCINHNLLEKNQKKYNVDPAKVYSPLAASLDTIYKPVRIIESMNKAEHNKTTVIDAKKEKQASDL